MLRGVFLLVSLKSVLCFIDLVSTGIAAGVGTVLYNLPARVKEATFCRFAECCSEENIPANTSGLRSALERNLYGQNIVIDEIVPALRAHFTNGDKSRKPLVISFHGSPGTGKSYTSEFIAQHLYKKGLNSKFVHTFVGHPDFPIESPKYGQSYKHLISQKVRKATSHCPWSLFIFDEVDRLPPGVFELITSFLDHSRVDGVNYRNAIFILLSNTAGEEIAQHLRDLTEKGVRREDTTMQDFEKILDGAYSSQGGLHLQGASIIEGHLVDHYIPFLPLERGHVEQCVRAEYSRLGVSNVDQSTIKRIVDNHVKYDKTGFFATGGCKRLSKKVEVDVFGYF